MATRVQRETYLKKHFSYEVAMLRYAFRRARARTDQLDYNMAYECFAVHARSIRDFLRNGDSTNFPAKHYAPDFKSKHDEKTNGTFDRINREVFHLGQRPDEPTEQVNFGDVVRAYDWIELNIAGFVAKLDSGYRKIYEDAVTTSPAETGPQLSLRGVIGPSASSYPEVSTTDTTSGHLQK